MNNKTPVKLNKGDAVFFKRAKHSSRPKSPEMEFQGHGFGIFLGHVPPFKQDPPVMELMRLVGTCGFLTFDDVAEFIGEENAAICVQKYEDKYYGKVVEQPPTTEEMVDKAAEVMVSEPSLILTASGTPMMKVLDEKGN